MPQAAKIEAYGTGIVGIEDHGRHVDTALSDGPNGFGDGHRDMPLQSVVPSSDAGSTTAFGTEPHAN